MWAPPADVLSATQIGRFLTWLAEDRGVRLKGYDELWRWSVSDLDGFWASVWDFFGVRARAPYRHVLGSRQMPGAQWFTGAELNYAEHAVGADGDTDRLAVLAHSQTRGPMELSFGDLREQVARARTGLQRLGVGPGDRVVAYLPNIPETLVAFLASASLGAVWATCAPEFGPRSVIARFGGVAPKVLLTVAGYRYGERPIDRRGEVAAIRAALPTLEHVVHVPYAGGPEDSVPEATGWDAPALRGGTAGVRIAALRPSAVHPVLLGHHRLAQGNRASPRGNPGRAPQEPRSQLGPAARRPADVVHDHGLDDVECADLGAAAAGIDRDAGR